MTNPTRYLISGRDFQVRYALWRMLEMAIDHDADHRDLFIRIEWHIIDNNDQKIYPDIIVENKFGEVLELIECKEHESFLNKDSVESFLKIVQRSKTCSQISINTIFRFVSTSPMLRIGTKAWDLNRHDERTKAFKYIGLSNAEELNNNIIWDFRFRGKTAVTTEFMMSLMGHLQVDRDECFLLYGKYYALLTAHMCRRLDPEGGQKELSEQKRLIDAMQLDVWRKKDPDRTVKLISTDFREAIAVSELHKELNFSRSGTNRSIEISAKKLVTALRRGLFGESKVSLEQIYVPQRANLTVPVAGKQLSMPRSKEYATDLLFEWLSMAKEHIATNAPLLVLGNFGSGKSSLLTWFGLRLLQRQIGIIPLLIPLRDLRAPSNRPISQILLEYVKRQWGADLSQESSEPSVKYCLICDGFDELNLYYMTDDSDQWVRDCFLELRRLAERHDIFMIISSRPVLLMDITKRSFEGSDCPRIDLDLFYEDQVEEWCSKYRQHSDISESFNLDFLYNCGLFEIVQTPLILYMAARLIELNPKSFKEGYRYSKAEIFQKFVDWTCEAGGYFKDKHKHKLPRDYRSIIRHIAWMFFQSGNPILEESKIIEDLHEKFGLKRDGIPIDRNILVAHMLQPSENTSASNDYERSNLIEYTHLAFREYLVAEKVWKDLTPIIDGEELDSRTWMGLSGQAFGTSEIDFLSDMINALATDKKLHLFNGLQNAALVHTYWQKWLSDVVDEIAQDPLAISNKSIKNRLSSQPVRACCMSTLAFIIRLKCYTHLKRQLDEDAFKKIQDSFHGAAGLSTILRFQESITGHIDEKSDNPSRPAIARSLLLQNLDGLDLKANSRLLNFNFEGISLQNATLKNIYFSGSEFHGADVSGANLEGSIFKRCLLWFTMAQGTSFRECDFSDSIIAQERSSELVGGDFSKASFVRTQFLNPAISEAKFVGNTWDGATVVCENEEPYLKNCSLDRESHTFFDSHGVTLVGCSVL